MSPFFTPFTTKFAYNTRPNWIEQMKPWQKSLIEAVTDPEELCLLLELPNEWLAPAKKAAGLFPLKVPRGFVARMKKGDANDPLLRQVLPLNDEFNEAAGFTKDPLREQASNPVSGLLHKYQGRVLLTLTSACAVNCRFCFRRHFDYDSNTPGMAGWESAIEYIKNNADILEVILSGGDPLVVNDAVFAHFLEKLSSIEHIKRLRIHTRMPIVLPERVTDEWVQILKSTRLQVVIVIHSNHPQEINSDVKETLQKLSGFTLLNQSVLLKGINDSADVLVELSEKLFECGVQPYYLHALDKVDGTAHFDTAEAKAIQLHADMANRLSGYLVPKLVREVAGAGGKILIS
jgi:EF-P beta-lysylation protein EpmB